MSPDRMFRNVYDVIGVTIKGLMSFNAACVRVGAAYRWSQHLFLTG